MELAKRLRMKRKALGLSVDAFAAKVGCSQGLVSQWENGMLPANLNKGAIARAKRILKVRARIVKPKPVKKPAAKPSKSPESPLLVAIAGLITTVNRLTLAIEAFDRHTRPASNPTGSQTAEAKAPAVLVTNSLDRKYPWMNKKVAQA